MTNVRTKIVCTLGPQSSSYQMILSLVKAGMNVARLNMSHGDYPTHARTIEHLRQAALETGCNLGIMADLQGPKLRIGEVKKDVQLEKGQLITICCGKQIIGDGQRISTPLAELAKGVQAGMHLLLDDGRLDLIIQNIQGQDLLCKVENGGPISSNKGIHIPQFRLQLAALTEKDRSDTIFALKQKVDFIAMSFVQEAKDIRDLRNLVKHVEYPPALIAKIEKPQALENIEAIVDQADAVMVARGDLGVETSPETVPLAQKKIISCCNARSKPVITATQMLESMVENPIPTRAEASDVANAIFDGTDAVMLSAETATGRFPLEAVKVMQRIIAATEATQSEASVHHVHQPLPNFQDKIVSGISQAACALAESTRARAIVAITFTGAMAARLSSCRPGPPVIAVSHHPHTLRSLALHRGVEGILQPNLNCPIEQALPQIEAALLAQNLVKEGDVLVITAGVPFASVRYTNTIRAAPVGESSLANPVSKKKRGSKTAA